MNYMNKNEQRRYKRQRENILKVIERAKLERSFWRRVRAAFRIIVKV